MSRALLLAALSAVSTAMPAVAAPDCEALAESEFISLVLNGQAAADRGNPDTYLSVVEELRGRMPCLTFAPRPRVLADYLVLEALVEFGSGGDWKTPLAAAIRVRPGVDRVVGSAHPMARFEPEPSAATERQPVPEGAQVFVDGEAASSLPPIGELHLVQVTDGGLWRTRVFNGDAVTVVFLTDPIEAPLVWTYWGNAGVAIGAGGVLQRRDDSWEINEALNGGEDGFQAAFIPNRDNLVAWPAIVARGGASYGFFGIAAELDVGLAGLTRPVGSHAQVAVVLGRPALRLGAGAGVGGSTKIQGVNAAIQPDTDAQYIQTSDGLPYVLGTAIHTSERWDAGVAGGFGPSTLRGSLYGGFTRRAEDGDVPLRLGFSASAQRGWFALGEVAADEVTTITWRAGFEVGVRL